MSYLVEIANDGGEFCRTAAQAFQLRRKLADLSAKVCGGAPVIVHRVERVSWASVLGARCAESIRRTRQKRSRAGGAR